MMTIIKKIITHGKRSQVVLESQDKTGSTDASMLLGSGTIKKTHCAPLSHMAGVSRKIPQNKKMIHQKVI